MIYKNWLKMGGLLVALTLTAQSPGTYWGLNWKMTPGEVDAVLAPKAKAKKAATKYNYDLQRQLVGTSYLIQRKGIEKIYTWFHQQDGKPIALQSLEIIYRFDYPYEASRFQQAYEKKYKHTFKRPPEQYVASDSTQVRLTIVQQPEPGHPGRTYFKVTLISPLKYSTPEKPLDVLF